LGVTVDLAILLCPCLLTNADGRHRLEPGPLWLRGGLAKAGEHRVAVLATRGAERVSLGLVCGFTVVLAALSVARTPLRLDPWREPLRGDGGHDIERMPQGFTDQFALVERLHSSKDVGRVRTLAAAGVEPALVLAPLEQAIQQTLFATALHQARPKLGSAPSTERPRRSTPAPARTSSQSGPAPPPPLGGR
jgi:hypothetical protein